jgi:hypothetical protein
MGKPVPDFYPMASKLIRTAAYSLLDCIRFGVGLLEYSVFQREDHPVNPSERIISNHSVTSNLLQHED